MVAGGSRRRPNDSSKKILSLWLLPGLRVRTWSTTLQQIRTGDYAFLKGGTRPEARPVPESVPNLAGGGGDAQVSGRSFSALPLSDDTLRPDAPHPSSTGPDPCRKPRGPVGQPRRRRLELPPLRVPTLSEVPSPGSSPFPSTNGNLVRPALRL